MNNMITLLEDPSVMCFQALFRNVFMNTVFYLLKRTNHFFWYPLTFPPVLLFNFSSCWCKTSVKQSRVTGREQCSNVCYKYFWRVTIYSVPKWLRIACLCNSINHSFNYVPELLPELWYLISLSHITCDRNEKWL